MNIGEQKLKLSKPWMGGTRSKLVYIIGYCYYIKLLNTNRSYSVKLTTYLFVKLKLLVVSTLEQFELNI